MKRKWDMIDFCQCRLKCGFLCARMSWDGIDTGGEELEAATKWPRFGAFPSFFIFTLQLVLCCNVLFKWNIDAYSIEKVPIRIERTSVRNRWTFLSSEFLHPALFRSWETGEEVQDCRPMRCMDLLRERSYYRLRTSFLIRVRNLWKKRNRLKFQNKQ